MHKMILLLVCNVLYMVSSSNRRILAIETGGCPHAAIREDISANLGACETLTARHKADIVLVESGGGASNN